MFSLILSIFIIIIDQPQLASTNGTRPLTKEAVTNFLQGLATNITTSISISITLDPTPHQKSTKVKKNGQYVTLPVYTGSDDISGRIDIQIINTNKYEHLGLKCYLIGMLQIYSDSTLSTEFTTLSKELQPVGYLTSNKTYKFKFSNFDKDYQSFRGYAGKVRYFIRASMNRNIIGPLVEEHQFEVFKNEISINEIKPTIIEVGVEDRLHIEFIISKNSYHIKEWVQGSVIFHLVRMPIKKMELSIIRKQTLGTLQSSLSRSKVLQTFEVMDGCPQQGSTIPFRMCMRGVKNLAPSYKSIHNRLFVRHWLNLVITDDDGRRYFKQSEVTFYRI